MSERPRPIRKLTEAQAEAILRRAAELQALREGGDDHEQDIGLDQLAEAASEVGLSQELVRKAAGEVLQSPRSTHRQPVFIGVPTPIFDQILPGSLHPDELQDLIEELRGVAGQLGSWSATDREFKWSVQQGLSVKVTPVGKNSRVEVAAMLKSSCMPTASILLITVIVCLFALAVDETVAWKALLAGVVFAGIVSACSSRPLKRSQKQSQLEASRAYALIESRLRSPDSL